VLRGTAQWPGVAVDKRCVSRAAPTVVSLLALASICVVVGSVVWAWATFDFWETVPLVPCAGASGLLAAGAVYSGWTGVGLWRRAGLAVFVGVAVALATFIGTGLMTLYRWEG
jgi:hypothetical protein